MHISSVAIIKSNSLPCVASDIDIRLTWHVLVLNNSLNVRKLMKDYLVLNEVILTGLFNHRAQLDRM